MSELSVTLGQVARYSGGSGYRMDERMKEVAAPILELAKSLAEPAFSFCVRRTSDLEEGPRKLFLGCENQEDSPAVCLCVCTLGEKLEKTVANLTRNGKFLEGALLDAAGVGLLESLGKLSFKRVQDEARRRGLYCGCRSGPGYDGAPLESQKLVFSLLNGGDIGVGLSDSFVMSPAKSLSYWVAFHTTSRVQADIYKCAACDLADCSFRIVEHKIIK
jgi:hypothetical protein